MNRGELRDRCRKRLDDAAQPHLWNEADLDYMINEAYRQTFLRGRLLTVTNTFAITLGTDYYSPALSILYVEALYLASDANTPLNQISMKRLEREYGSVDAGSGTPYWYALDVRTGSNYIHGIRLFPNPDANDTGSLRYIAYPGDMDDDADTPEIPVIHHDGLIDGVCMQAYLDQDSESANPQVAAMYEARFTQRFGELLSASVIHDRQTEGLLEVVPW